jgi:hypothetical protein
MSTDDTHGAVRSNEGLGGTFSRKCPRPKCNGDMLPGVAIGQTFTGIADFPGCKVVTVSQGGPGKIVQCLKCNACGHSVSA